LCVAGCRRAHGDTHGDDKRTKQPSSNPHSVPAPNFPPASPRPRADMPPLAIFAPCLDPIEFGSFSRHFAQPNGCLPSSASTHRCLLRFERTFCALVRSCRDYRSCVDSLAPRPIVEHL
jgi:hypothetical protein